MKNMKKYFLKNLFVLIVLLFFVSSCSKEETKTANNIENLDLLDFDGNGYSIAKIGSQIWIQQNLNVSHYKNGDEIPQVTNFLEWKNLKTGAWCYYNNDPNRGKTYGKLYNWYAVNDPRGLAPKGYKISSKNDYDILIDFLGGKSIAAGKMKSTNLWHSPNTGGTNSSLFSALPGGLLDQNDNFSYIGDNGFWWTSTENNESDANFIFLTFLFEKTQSSSQEKRYGLSVRCLKE